jgi:hypothetical protein
MASERSTSSFRRATALVAASLALLLLPLVWLAADAGASTTLPIALQQFKVVSYMPVRASWTNMWSEFDPTEIKADFQKVAELGANTVRIAIDPFEFGWPNVTPQMASELSEVLSLAQAQGLYVQLTLFDWWTSYSQISSSKAWLSSLLGSYTNDHEIAFIELQNEIDPNNAAAMAWATAILPAAKAVAGDIPLTFSISSTSGLSGILALKSALGPGQLSFYDFHYYGSPGAAAATLGAVKAAVAPAPLFVGEIGFSTYTAGGAPQEAILDSEQASFYAGVDNATASLGLPAPGLFMLNDLDGSGAPGPESNKPQDWSYGLFTTTGQKKPAEAVVQQFFTTGSAPVVLDPSFQTASGGVPTGWLYSGPGTGTWSTTVTHSGSPTVEINDGSGDPSAWRSVLGTGTISAGEKIQVTAWAKGSAATGSNALDVAWFNSSNNYISNQVSPLPSGNSNWTELGVDAVAPSGAAYAVVYLQTITDTGTVWFDDVSATVITTGVFPPLP